MTTYLFILASVTPDQNLSWLSKLVLSYTICIGKNDSVTEYNQAADLLIPTGTQNVFRSRVSVFFFFFFFPKNPQIQGARV